MRYREFIQPSPNFDAQPVHERLGVLFHHSVLSFDETIAHMLRPASKVSYHVLVGLDGTRCVLVSDDHIAWHAGASEFRGRARCNDFLLGVAFAGDTYTQPLTDAQLASVVEWLDARWRRHGWSLAWMVDHRQVAPGRKNDLNPVEWTRLQRTLTEHFANAK